MRFLFLFLLLPLTLLAQPTARTDAGWQELTIADGLSQGMIYDLKQDRTGFIWIATKDGLNRYDGHNFAVFTHDPYNTFSLSDNGCSALLIDRHGRLWVGTLGQGLNLYDSRRQRFYHIAISNQSVSNAGSYEIQLLAEDPDGNIWVGTNNDKILKITLPPSLKTGFPDQADFTEMVRATPVDVVGRRDKNTPLALDFQPDGQGFMGGAYGVYAFNWRKPTSASPANRLTDQTAEFHSIVQNLRQRVWIGAVHDKIICWYGGKQKTIALPGKNYPGVRVAAVAENTLAIATPDHLWLLSPAELLAQDSLTVRRAFTAFPPNVYAINAMLYDKTGNLWAGTSGYGLRKFNPKIRRFQNYLPNTSLTQLYVDRQQRTYVRHEFAYDRLDPGTNRLLPFLNPALPAPDKRQRNLMQDRQGIFWVSNVNFDTHTNQLFKFSEDWQLLKKYPLPPGTSFGWSGNQTLEDSAGNLWIGATNGKLLCFDRQTETFRVFGYQHLLPQSGAEIETYALHIDRRGTGWIGTQKGLVKADHLLTAPAFSIYKNSVTDRQSLSNDFVSTVVDDPYNPDQYLWVSTKGGGLERLNKQTGHFEHFTEDRGLPNNVVYGILTDAYKNLWMSTNRGLAQFDPKTQQFRSYTKADGLQDNEFNTSSFFKGSSGELLFGGINGLTRFWPSAFRSSVSSSAPVRIIGLMVNNKTVAVGGPDAILTQGIEQTTQLDLSHTQNLVTLEFGLMDFTNPAKNRYRYRLTGIDQDWVEAGTNRFANYAQLPPGNYGLEVMGSADGAVWSKSVALQIRVHPPFYRTWWAYLVYLTALVLIGWQWYRFQTQRLLLRQQLVFEQQEANRLTELDALKTQFFTNISHEFRTPLTLILGPLADLKKRLPAEPLLTLMERNAHRLLNLINQLLDLSKLEAGRLTSEPEPGDMAAFFRTVASSFGSLADSRGIRFSFEQEPTTYPAQFDRDKVEKIATNLLANAFKFTPAGNAVRMAVAYLNQTDSQVVSLTVQDTGIGIAADKLDQIFNRFYQGFVPTTNTNGSANRNYEGTGIGLALVKELVTVLNGSISVTSTEGQGSTFVVTLPLTKTTVIVPARVATVSPVPVFARVTEEQPQHGSGLARQTPAETPENSLLIIDDNADIQAYIRSIFEADYHILEAVDGLDGLEQATASTPNIIICDLMMPRLDGFGFCRALKTQPATSHIPVVMLTAKATVEDRVEGFGLGADDYLTKPFNRDELRARVQNLVEKQARLRHYFSNLTTNVPTDARPEKEPVAEDAFVQKAIAVAEQHLPNAGFTVEQFSQQMNMSQSQLVRKLKALTNQTAVEFVRNRRLVRAAELLRQGDDTVSEVAYRVGFESLSYFTRVFHDKFGVIPSAYPTGRSAQLPG